MLHAPSLVSYLFSAGPEVPNHSFGQSQGDLPAPGSQRVRSCGHGSGHDLQAFFVHFAAYTTTSNTSFPVLLSTAGLGAADPVIAQPEAVWTGGTNAEALHLAEGEPQHDDSREVSASDNSPVRCQCEDGSALGLRLAWQVWESNSCSTSDACTATGMLAVVLLHCPCHALGADVDTGLHGLAHANLGMLMQEVPPPKLASVFPMHASLDELAPADAGAKPSPSLFYRTVAVTSTYSTPATSRAYACMPSESRCRRRTMCTSHQVGCAQGYSIAQGMKTTRQTTRGPRRPPTSSVPWTRPCGSLARMVRTAQQCRLSL